jgi:peptidoglycan biosynthesis protein MviN/MurJ (putative lipid II flippase)
MSEASLSDSVVPHLKEERTQRDGEHQYQHRGFVAEIMSACTVASVHSSSPLFEIALCWLIVYTGEGLSG